MKEAGFVHLHCHTEYSLLDGASRIKPLCEQAARFRMPALAITDHGNMFGAVEFFKAARAAGVKPIIGCETYVAPRSMTDRVIHADIPESSFHLTLLCETLEGYHNLVKLVSRAYLEGFYYRPRIDKDLLSRHSKGLIALSACFKGEVNYHLLRGEPDKARAVASQYREIMGPGNFYLEVMRLGLPDCARAEAGAEQLGQELGIPRIATNDCHYLHRSDAEAHDVLICLQTGKRLKEKARMKFETEEVYFKSPQEMAKLFADRPEMIGATLDVAGRCNVVLDAEGRNFALPVFPRPGEYDTDIAYLTELARKGLAKRYGSTPGPEAQERLDHELGVISKMGFSGYFLIVRDIVDYARSKGIPVGPGRGSAVGSLVLYCLGITDVDPLRYGLIFERFLTAERVSLPDIDVDFADARRAEVIAYIRQRYREDCVAQIITFGTMAARAAVRDVGRVLDIPLAEVDRLAKLVPFNSTLGAALKESKELRELVRSRPDYERLFAIAQRVEGIARHASIHASGVVITPRPLMESVPLYRSTEGDVCTQYDMTMLEAIGLLKMDILGLRTLSVIAGARELLQAEGIAFEPEAIPLNDPKTYELLRAADVVGVFQLESSGMQNLLVKTKPENLEDIMAVISLFRPGPMGNVKLDEYIARKEGRLKTKLMHPALDEVLKDTHGVIIYQEQVMKIANLVAGFSLSEADRLRRVMAKKVPEQMSPMREKFVAGARARHVKDKLANEIFDLIEPFAGYGFNKSHAAGYAFLSCTTAYLKANYPVEFMTATLTSEIGNSDKLRKFIFEVKRMGLTLQGPDVNASDYRFTIERATGDESSATGLRPQAASIRFGLGGIKNLGQGVCEAIVQERVRQPYSSLRDFIARTRKSVNRKALESLVMAGAFDRFNPDRQELMNLLPEELERGGSARAVMLERQASLFQTASDKPQAPSRQQQGPPQAADCNPQTATYEKAALGFYLSSHPLEEYRLEMEAVKCCPLERLETKENNDQVTVAGVITARRFKKDKNGRDYAILQFEDLTGTGEVMVFSNTLETNRALVKEDMPLLITGRIRTRGEGQASIWADSLQPLGNARGRCKSLTVRLRGEEPDEKELLALRQVLETHPGKAAVMFHVRENGRDRLVRVRDLQVQPSTALVRELQSLPVVQAVKVNGL